MWPDEGTPGVGPAPLPAVSGEGGGGEFHAQDAPVLATVTEPPAGIETGGMDVTVACQALRGRDDVRHRQRPGTDPDRAAFAVALLAARAQLVPVLEGVSPVRRHGRSSCEAGADVTFWGAVRSKW